jgi:hypothetical protein
MNWCQSVFPGDELEGYGNALQRMLDEVDDAFADADAKLVEDTERRRAAAEKRTM